MSNMLWWIPLAAIVVLVLHELQRPRDSSSSPRVIDLTSLIGKRKR